MELIADDGDAVPALMAQDRDLIELVISRWSWARAGRRKPLRVNFRDGDYGWAPLSNPVELGNLVFSVPHHRLGSTLEMAWGMAARHAPDRRAFLLHHVVAHYFHDNAPLSQLKARSPESLRAEGLLKFAREMFRRPDGDIIPPATRDEFGRMLDQYLESALGRGAGCSARLRGLLN